MVPSKIHKYRGFSIVPIAMERWNDGRSDKGYHWYIESYHTDIARMFKPCYLARARTISHAKAMIDTEMSKIDRMVAMENRSK